MTEWRKVKLGDCCEITSSKRIFYNEYVESGVPFYRSKEIIEKAKGDTISTPLYISHERFEEIKESFGAPQKSDILLTAVGSLGVPYLINDSTPFYFKDGNLIWFKSFDDDLNSVFLYYWFKTRNASQMLDKIAIGSAQKALTISSIKQISIEIPARDIQDRIVTALSRYDALIENYQRQIKLLEEAAQRLYKEWFVDLRFPGHQSSPIINNLPQSWQKKKLGEIVKTTSGGTPSRGKPEYYTGDILWVKTKELNDSFILDTEEKISIEAINKSSAKILPSGSVLLAMYGATIGKLGIASKKMACNQACCVFLFDDNDVFRWFLYNWLIINRSFLISQGKGAAQPNLSQDMIKNFETIIPDTPLLEKYHRMVAPLYDRIINNQAQIRNLSEARDRLLPKLMSAEIEI